MEVLTVFSETGAASGPILSVLRESFVIHQFAIDSIHSRTPGRLTLFEIDLDNATRAALLRSWLAKKPFGAKAVVALKKQAPAQSENARRLGVDRIFVQPFEPAELRDYLLDRLPGSRSQQSLLAGVQAAAASLDTLFASVRAGIPIDPGLLSQGSQDVVAQVGDAGLADWMEVVRKHHDRTYQHCLLVTGVAVAFAQHLGFSAADQARLWFCGMIHDLGKARIPLAILDKPGQLDEHEWQVMRQHPQLGVDALAEHSEISPQVVDVVLHHHEYLDGSGYPHGLSGSEIPDLVRLMTIADIFGALMEKRAYKPPLPAAAAYSILLDMGPKLDPDMVREFAAVASLRRPEQSLAR